MIFTHLASFQTQARHVFWDLLDLYIVSQTPGWHCLLVAHSLQPWLNGASSGSQIFINSGPITALLRGASTSVYVLIP